MKVGTRELQNRLSHYLRLARDGEPVQVIDHGKIVAEIRAPRASVSQDEVCLQILERESLVTKRRKQLDDFAPLVARGKKRLSDIVIEDRD